jgi:hypothetical protein
MLVKRDRTEKWKAVGLTCLNEIVEPLYMYIEADDDCTVDDDAIAGCVTPASSSSLFINGTRRREIRNKGATTGAAIALRFRKRRAQAPGQIEARRSRRDTHTGTILTLLRHPAGHEVIVIA